MTDQTATSRRQTEQVTNPAAATHARAARPPWRIIGPLAAVVLLTLLTLIVHVVRQDDPGDPAYLSPASDAGVGAAALAGRLTAAGVRIDRETSSAAAISAAGSAEGEVTLFIPEPSFLSTEHLADLADLPERVRLVLVAPNDLVLAVTELDAVSTGSRWAAAAPAAGCAEAWATGPAALLRRRYAPTGPAGAACYSGGVLEVYRGNASVTLVGAADAFRNDRRHEHANAQVTTALLARDRTVVWLDLHTADPLPPPPPPRATGTPEQPADTGGGTQGRGDASDRSDESSPSEPSIVDAFPPAFWATIGLLALAGIALAVAAARRLGTPVPEPLPVRVPAAETVRGLGRLYRRARADRDSLATLQAAARRRIADQLGLPPDAPLADRIPGVPPADVDRLLDDPDQDLATTAQAVQNLVRHVKGMTT